MYWSIVLYPPYSPPKSANLAESNANVYKPTLPIREYIEEEIIISLGEKIIETL